MSLLVKYCCKCERLLHQPQLGAEEDERCLWCSEDWEARDREARRLIHGALREGLHSYIEDWTEETAVVLSGNVIALHIDSRRIAAYRIQLIQVEKGEDEDSSNQCPRQ